MTNGETSYICGAVKALRDEQARCCLFLDGGWYVWGKVLAVSDFTVLISGSIFGAHELNDALLDNSEFDRHDIPLSRIVALSREAKPARVEQAGGIGGE